MWGVRTGAARWLGMRLEGIVLGLLVLGMLVAGCTGNGDDAGTSSTDAGPETGGIQGTVLDGEQLPVAGAAVGVQSGDDMESTSTGDDGTFSFTGLAAGEWELSIKAAFYEDVDRTVQVVAGNLAEVRIELERVAAETQQELFIEQSIEEGFINLAYSFPWTSGQTLGGSLGQDMPNERSHFPLPYNPELALTEVVLELVWEPATGVTGTRLQIAVCDEPTVKDTYNNCFNVPDSPQWAVRLEGESPLVLRIPDLPVKNITDFRIAVGDGGGERPPVTFQQSFTLYISTCYGTQPCPPDYQLRPPE